MVATKPALLKEIKDLEGVIALYLQSTGKGKPTKKVEK